MAKVQVLISIDIPYISRGSGPEFILDEVNVLDFRVKEDESSEDLLPVEIESVFSPDGAMIYHKPQ
jgi:hypothetical protein